MERLGLSAVWDILSILSPYHENCELVKRQVLELYAEDREYIDQFEAGVSSVVCSVSSCQRFEDCLIIYTPGCGHMRNRPVERESLIDSICELYVLTKKPQCNMVYVEAMG